MTSQTKTKRSKGSGHVAKTMTDHAPLPIGAELIGHIDHHPADVGVTKRRYAVLRFIRAFYATWDGRELRSLSGNWRDLVVFTPADRKP